MKTIYEIKEKNKGNKFCQEFDIRLSGELESILPSELFRTELPLPDVSELDVVRHYTKLSQRTMGVDTNFYPLGSCTMKYNPKINERIADLEGFRKLHPYQPENYAQGILSIMFELERMLCDIGGMDAVTLQPSAGAHGEFTGLLIIKKHLKEIHQENRNSVLIPDSAHGTNPASSTLCSFKVKQIKSSKDGLTSVEDLKKVLNEEVACLMITNPNTLGLFEKDIEEICDVVHKNGSLVYMDGANLNALVGLVRPGDFGVDVLHYNLHKTFSTPHGGGGPGAGPIGVKEFLSDYLPIPRIEKINDTHKLNYKYPKSIGRVKSFYGNVGVLIRAYVYICLNGIEGLRKVSATAVLNANYLSALLKDFYNIPYPTRCMHEFVISVSKQSKRNGVRALDIAKRLIDYGFHPPTIYFPLIVQEAMMIEPTETENKKTLEEFAEAMIKIAKECEESSEKVKNAPRKAFIKRADEVRAAKEQILTFDESTNSVQPTTREV